VEQPKLEDKVEEAVIAKVQAVDCRWSHASFDELSRLMKNAASEFEGMGICLQINSIWICALIV
jgi:hypothetical protein